MTTTIKAVETCASCPFADDGEITDGEWTCHAKLTREGWPRHLHESHSPPKPPRWCPLRRGAIIVKLRIPRKP